MTDNIQLVQKDTNMLNIQNETDNANLFSIFDLILHTSIMKPILQFYDDVSQILLEAWQNVYA